MQLTTHGHPYLREGDGLTAGQYAAHQPDDLPAIPASWPVTGTVDDDDEPEDEHVGENEAATSDHGDHTEAPEEFKRDDEDRLDLED